MSERCPKCGEGVLWYTWDGGWLRLVCGNPRCGVVLTPGYEVVETRRDPTKSKRKET